MLGARVRDKITGLTGVVTGHVRYITGCNQALVQPPVGEDGVMRESHWIDEQRLESTGDVAVVLDNGANPGSDKAAPRR